MEQAVKYITERFTRKLSRNQNYFTPSDLREAGFPTFLTERIRIELETNLADSVVPPETDWALMNAPDVTAAWENFLDAIHNQVRLPQAYAKGVMETCVNDLVDLLTEPRRHLPEYIFGSENELSAEQVSERVRKVVVYRHLAAFLPRYMQNKKLERISRDRYQRAMEQLDDKLSRKYSPLNWAQLFEPLFALSNGDIEPEFIARFFRDKDMLVMAARFDTLQDPVDNQRVIELLSLPVYSDDEYQKPEIVTAHIESAAAAQGDESDAEPEPEPEEEAQPESESQQGPKDPEPAVKLSPAESGDEAAEADEDEHEHEHEDEDREDEPLYARLRNPDSDEDEKLPGINGKTGEGSSKQKKSSFAPVSDTDNNDFENIPLWQRLSATDDNGITDETKPEEEAEAKERSEPFEHPDSRKPKPGDIQEYLKDEQDQYVREIFKGDEEAYKSALTRLAAFSSWREAGKYLTNDIFRKNRIDMYKDVTVDFTDRLHKFFKNRE